MARFVYHMVPQNFRGTTLFPLNQLRDVYPDLYEAQRAKYEDHPYRKTLPFRRLPKLDCLWNDVLHFSPVNPKIIYKEWTNLGGTLKGGIRWFAIPVDRLAAGDVGVFHARPENWSTDRDHELEEEYSLLDLSSYTERATLRPETTEWYRSLTEQGRRGAYFMYIPHILAKGTVSVEGLEPFAWGD